MLSCTLWDLLTGMAQHPWFHPQVNIRGDGKDSGVIAGDLGDLHPTPPAACLEKGLEPASSASSTPVTPSSP